MHALRKIRFQFGMTPPAILLFAASLAPRVHTLEFTTLRIDDPFVIQSFFNFPHLTSLSMSNGGSNRNIDAVRDKELSNVSYILRTLSEQLLDLEISGGLVEYSTLMGTDWPFLRTLIILDHVPQGPTVPLSSVLSRMPCLRTFSYSFAIQRQEDPHPFFTHLHPQTYEYQPTTSKEHPRLPPKLNSVNIANPPLQYPMFDYLPHGLEVLRILPRPFLEPILPAAFDETDLFYLLTKASRFAYLRELSITLHESPSPAILSAVVKACPSIYILEVGQTAVSEREPTHAIVSP